MSGGLETKQKQKRGVKNEKRVFVTPNFLNQFWGLSRNVAEFFFDWQLQNIKIKLFWKLKENSCVGSALIIGKSRVLIFACFQLSRIKKWHDLGSKSWEAEKYFISIDPQAKQTFFLLKKIENRGKTRKMGQITCNSRHRPLGYPGGFDEAKNHMGYLVRPRWEA